MRPRRFARELALLGMSQLSSKTGEVAAPELDSLLTTAVRSLAAEVHDALEVATGEVQRAQDELLQSETRTSTLEEARVLLEAAMEHTQSAINRLGSSLQIPEMVQLSNREEIRSYAIELMETTHRHRVEVDRQLDEAMVSWQVKRLPQIDRDILRIAVTEMKYLDVADRIAINEAVEIAKRYSDDDGYRFINGVLRRWVNRFLNPFSAPLADPDADVAPLPTDTDAPMF